MRRFPTRARKPLPGRAIALAVLLALSAALAVPAQAQVTINNSALDALGKPYTAAPKPRPAQVPAKPVIAPATPAANAPSPAKIAPAATAAPAAPAPPPAAPPITLPDAPPALATLPPPAASPRRAQSAAPVIPLAADAPGEAAPLIDGTSISFGPGRADLNPRTEAAIRKLAATAATKPDQPVTILAYAPGVPEDPSTPRRLSLARGMAARSVLLAAGIASERILIRAIGPDRALGVADRADIIIGPADNRVAFPPSTPKPPTGG